MTTRRYLDGEPVAGAPGKQEWLDRLRADTAACRVRRNVHVVRAPLSAYLRYQFEWCYVPNAAAGQEIRILDVTEIPAAAALHDVGDFTAIESEYVARLCYSPDGEYQGAATIGADAAAVFVALAKVAWTLATPFDTWWAEHSQYHRPTVAA
ncbi:MAG: DUF6879 family protein [Pseudonocardiaceae bacterium]